MKQKKLYCVVLIFLILDILWTSCAISDIKFSVLKPEIRTLTRDKDIINPKAGILNPELKVPNNNINILSENNIQETPGLEKLRHLTQDIDAIKFTESPPLHNRQETNIHDNVIHGFDKHDVTIPIRIHHETGKPHSHGKHFRAQQSTIDDEEFNDIDVHHEVANFTFSAFGENFSIHLTPKSDFISPTYSLQFMGNLTSSNEKHLEELPRHCFYSGHVNNDTSHTVVVSLCGGMFGAFRTDEADFIIQPHTDATLDDVTDEFGTKPHKIFKRSIDAEKKAKDLCAFEENEEVETKNGRRIDPSKIHHITQNSRHRRATHGDKHSRSKRYLSYPRHVEVMVTADNLMYRTHGHNLHHYVLTLMAIVNHIYLDPSIGNLINIVLVKLIVITDDQYERGQGPHVTKNAHQCLRNFCRWQATQNDPDDSHPDHHDTAVLITRQDICRTENACDTLGLAEMGTMCDHYRSCSINEDNGLSTAFTIAHEIGHEFNAPHDNNDKCKTLKGYSEEMHVMSPQLDHNAKPWSWSKCSAKFITSFLDYGNGQCLLDAPPQRVLPLPLEQPGQIFDVNSQCSFVYGKGVTHCGFMNTCGRLWCVNKDRGGGCRTPHMPWADGTKCGQGKWCQRGVCVPENKHLTPVKGSWGGWSEFGACSRKCGGGIQIATRNCVNPAPANGGKFCVGRRKQFRSCAWNECAIERDFRAEQCSKYDHWANNHSGQRIRGIPSNVRWVPKYDGIMLQDRCKLICQVKSSDEYTAPWYVLHPKVINGTPCGPNTHDICIEGICMKAGCDHVLNSNTQEDDCGVCGGDNTGCKTIKSSYNIGNREGYGKVVVLPVGATNILIEQTSYLNSADDNNFLALRDSRGHYILNGGKSVVQYRHRIFKRSPIGSGMIYDFDYSGTDNTVEVLNSSSPLKESITVEVLQAGDLMPPNIKYKYNLPSTTRMSYHWDPYGPWSECSRICQGNSKRKVFCKNSDDNIVSDSHCHERNKPTSIKQYCNTDCEIRWHVGRIECSSRCGEGVETKHSTCVKVSTSEDGRRQIENLHDRDCTSPKPTSGATCHGNCLPTRWEYENWSQCTKTCNGGLQTRKAICRDVRGVELSPQECKDSVRVVSQTCNNQACPQWVTSTFTECSTTCGSYSVRSRRVWCRSATRAVESNDKCNPLRKPSATVTCNVVECPIWSYAEWQPCSMTCGVGTTMRRVTCVDNRGNQIDENRCDSATRELDIKDCVIEPDCYVFKPPVQQHADMVIVNRRTGFYHSTASQWRTGDWTSCSVSCGRGTQERYVSCRNNDLVEQNDCPIPEPDRIQECNMGSCTTAEWRSSAWSDCTTTCGQGSMTRFVWCVEDDRNTIDETPCQVAAQKPVAVSTCLLKPCTITTAVPTTALRNNPSHYPGTWRHGPFSQCSSSCGPGTRRRVVQCQPRNLCNPNTKPTSTEPCDAATCPTWNISPWQQCTKTCGTGTEYRHVVCAMSDGTHTLDEHCEIMRRPIDTQACNTEVCPEIMYKWKTFSWSQCSRSCEKGVKTRHVACINKNQIIVDDEYCSGIRAKKPRTTRGCRVQKRCPRWHTTRWNRCTVTCGMGSRLRTVTCRYRRKIILDSQCDASTKPQITTACNSSPCHTYSWKLSSWGRCSAYCGTGYQTRTVSCMRSDRQTSITSKCPGSKPAERNICKIQDCPAVWWTGTWSRCTRTCGRGVHTRPVLCVQKDSGAQNVVDSILCNGRKPLESRDCNYNECSSDVQWRVGIWGECSVTCGSGSRSRRVYCARKSTNQELSLQNCENTASFKPDSQTACTLDPCIPTSCYNAKHQLRQRLDGEYRLLVQGRVTKIYCKDMNTYRPKEFVTLSEDGEETYSEMYKYRLLDPTTCPLNDDDSQRFTAHSQAGKTIFKKIRIDIVQMKIIPDDFSFATTLHGIPTKVGVAGDCYSKVQCPRGSFRINLKNTGFAVSERTQWVSYGRAASRDTNRAKDGSSVYGKCGGYCSHCQPDPAHGLLLIHSRET